MKKTIVSLMFSAFAITGSTVFAFDSFRDAMKAGDAAKQEKKHAEAAAAYQEGYEKAVDSSRKYAAGSRYARALLDSGKRDEAVKIGKEVMELKELSQSQKRNAVYMYAWYLQMAGKHAESETVLVEALKADQYIEFYDIYVNSLIYRKKFDAAKSVLSEMEKRGNTETLKKRVIEKKERLAKAVSGK